MKSATAITSELDDINVAAWDLIGQIRGKIEFCKHSIGIMHAQPKMDLNGLSTILSRELGFSIIGGTTASAAIISNDGYHELEIMLHVLTADDCFFSAAISESLSCDTEKRIKDTYEKAVSGLKQYDPQAEPKMIFCVTTILNNQTSGKSFYTLSELCDGVPLFGYVAADDSEYLHQQVFLDSISGGDMVAVLAVSGNIKPVFEIKNLEASQTLSKKRVTKSCENIIYEIDGHPAYEYFSEFPFITNTDTNTLLWSYQFFVEMQNESDNDGVSVSRALNTYDKEKGTISCYADIPEDSYIGLQYCSDANVKASCRKAILELLDKINAASGDGYKYSTVFIASCCLRNIYLASQKDAEGLLVHEMIPDDLTVSGLYAYGEIAPTSIRNGKAVNRLHNATMTICAF